MKLNLTALTVAAITAVHPSWLELVGINPDHGSGSVEGAITVGAVAVALAATGRIQRLRQRA